MFTKVATILAVVWACNARPSDPYHEPVHKARPYNYAYHVADAYSGVDFGQDEKSDGKAVSGSYNVQLPDGRKQTVTYTADHHKGLIANVEYYGEAQYPHEYGPPITFKPHGGYKPEPSYH